MAEPDPDIKEMVEESAERFAETSVRLGLLNWAYSMFSREHKHHDAADWRGKSSAPGPRRWWKGRRGERPPSVHGAPGIVAAVCIRDHWDEMNEDERGWCIERACVEVLEEADNWNEMHRAQRFDMMPDRSGAWVMAGLLGRNLTVEQRKRIEAAFVAGLTHPTEEVRWYAVWGIARQLWSIDPGIALRSVNAIALEAAILWDARREDEKRRYDERQGKAAAPKAAASVRSKFWKDEIPPNSYQNLDVSEWPGTQADAQALTILAQAPDEAAAVTGFTRLATTFVGWWDSDSEEDRGRGQGRLRDYHAAGTLRDRLGHFLLRTSETIAGAVVQPILDSVDRHPRQVHDIVKGLTAAEDGQVNTAQYWFLWKLFAERIRPAKWVKHLPAAVRPVKN